MWSSAGLVLLVGVIAAFGQSEKPVPLAPLVPMTTVNVENTLTTEERAQGWKLLFDGKTTTGWRGYKQKDMPAGWQVIDGALVRTGAGRSTSSPSSSSTASSSRSTGRFTEAATAESCIA